ncbi:MAG: carbamoyltransferase HypF [Lachnospiraceae bacterium]|nr:carbamoyltransferase HypF [Lachnospiraceae bacterium]
MDGGNISKNALFTAEIRVYGIVQGVGFRPTVSRHAMETGVTGTVCNKGPYVEIMAQGTEEQVESFLDALRHRPPKRAAILKLDVKTVDCETVYPDFQIIESAKTKGAIYISPDIAICDECKEEMYDPENRRYLHPFINCTCCGPRLTILDALPYDRERTSMKEFPMCPECADEYYSPETRRYDAQPVCCNDCGPEVYLIRTDGQSAKNREADKPIEHACHGREAITETRRIIADGGIVSIKGIGGFHLCCDASNEEAVSRLRRLKNRPMKPFAVMMRNEAVVHEECEVSELQEEILTGHQKPILLLKRKPGGRICPSVAPDNPKVGVMLPYAPVQMLLFDYDDGIVMPDVLVMTSGNVSGAPICRDDKDAVTELSHLCDAILSHNRLIRIRADDTVMDFFEGKPYMIRRSRGYAPLPFYLENDHISKGQVLAIGGELKNTFCISSDGLLYLSPYVGDLADLRTVEALKETIERFKTLLEVQPELVACDLHPRYHSTMVAESLGLPVMKVQHHYAHILSCMAENECTGQVIGVSMDGTGYGTDGTIWGGEIMLADIHGFKRLASIVPFMQIGGDLSAKEGWRIACAMLHDLIPAPEECLSVIRQLKLCDENTAKVQRVMADRRINAVTSTSAGRLFDGISAILGIRKASTFEGEASISLQFAAERYAESEMETLTEAAKKELEEFLKEVAFAEHLPAHELPAVMINNGRLYPANGTADPKTDDRRLLMPTDYLTKALLQMRLQGEDSGKLAYYFHAGFAAQIVETCKSLKNITDCNKIALSGGVFQNGLLLKLVVNPLREAGFEVLLHSMVPPNDGGIALGQALAALAAFEKKHRGKRYRKNQERIPERMIERMI